MTLVLGYGVYHVCKMLDMILPHQFPELEFSRTAEHPSELIQRYKIWITGKVIIIKLSAFHISVSL